MDPLEIVSFALDIVLIMAGILAFLARPRIGGRLAKGVRILLIGVMILGSAHLIETGMFVLFDLDRQVNEIIYRLLVGTGFVFVILGFHSMRRTFEI